jgi:6-phospho-3-hexuloisomerase
MLAYDALVNTVTAELNAALQSVDANELTNLRRDILQSRRIFVAGKGRSGLRMSGFAMRLMHLDQHVHVVGEVTAPAIGAGDLLIIGSGSGRTPSLVSYARQATHVEAQVTLITVAEESPIADYADSVIRIQATSPKIDSNDESLQPLGTLFEQALGVLLDIVVLQLMDDLNMDSDAMFSRHANLE